jgi:hypothetical protein
LIASLHLVEYEKRVLWPPRRLPSHVRGLHFWRPLHIGGDIGWFRTHSGRAHVYRHLLKPNFRRWAFYAIWDDDAALATFLNSSGIAHGWSDAEETCHFWLRPHRVRGPWQGMRLLHGFESGTPLHGPIAYLTRVELSPRGALAFWQSAAPDLSDHVPDDDEMPFALALADRPLTQMMVFSIWPSNDSALRFAYREKGHREAVARVRRAQHDVVERFSAASFEPFRYEGTWERRKLLAGADTPDAVKERTR